MPLTIIEKEDVMQSVNIELGDMFDRLLSHYKGPHHAEHALLLPELEAYIKAGLLEHPNPV